LSIKPVTKIKKHLHFCNLFLVLLKSQSQAPSPSLTEFFFKVPGLQFILAKPPLGTPYEQSQGGDDQDKEAYDALRPGVAKRMRGMPKRRKNHEEETQAQPERDAARHEHDGMASRNATAANVPLERTDKSPRCKGEDTARNEDCDR